MLTVLVVDDEPNIREGLIHLIDWNSLGYEMIGEAASSREALLLIEKYCPDLVITDISMPEMTGLELIEQVKIHRDTKFIILSGHNDFDKAKKAIELGAFNYLLKPVDEDELEQSLLKLKTVLNRDTNFLSSLPEANSYQYLLVDFFDETDTGYIMDLKKSVPDKVLLHEERPGLIGLILTSELLINFGGSLNRFMMDLISRIYIRTGLEISIYAGNVKETKSDIKNSRKEAYEVFKHRYYHKKSITIEYHQILNKRFSDRYTDLKEVDNFLSAIFTGNESDWINEANRLVELFIKEYYSADIINLYLNRILSLLLDRVQKLGLENTTLVETSSFISRRSEVIFLYDLKKQLIDLAGIASRLLQQVKGCDLVSRFKTFIDDRYTENLTLKYIADKMSVNPAYLGQVIRKNLGMSFNNYLHTFRLERSRDLLVRSSESIKTIATLVGYSDVNYFCKIFEKHSGISPSRYRISHKL